MAHTRNCKLLTDELIECWIRSFNANDSMLVSNSQLFEQELTLKELWRLMDLVWEEMNCNSNKLDNDKISAYYRHPIWLLNGFFVENHADSLMHRHAISDWIVQSGARRVIDFGGGFGTLARMIADKTNEAFIEIYEPYPSRTAISLCRGYHKVEFVDELKNGYDCLISTDVLEHVIDPLDLFAKMCECVKLDGYLLIVTHFYPSIKCHLPTTFHLRYSFDDIVEEMGIKKIGECYGSCASIYQKVSEKPFEWKKIRRKESISRLSFPFLKLRDEYIYPCGKLIEQIIVNPVGAFTKIRLKLSHLRY